MKAKVLTYFEKKKLEALFDKGAEAVETEPEYWIRNSDESLSYCFECCGKEVAQLLKEKPDEEYEVDGGFGTSGDSTPFCETCGKTLENTYTDSACEEDLGHFLEHGFNLESGDDCLSMSKMIASKGWEPWADMHYRNETDKQIDLDYYKGLHKLCRKILKEAV